MEQVKSDILVSIIIINYNTTALVYNCVESVTRFTTLPYEIILVDNASADRSIEQIKDEFPNVITILNSENIGFGRANNLAIAKAKGKYLFLLNSDTILTSDATSRFFNFMEDPQHSNIACCGGCLIKLNGEKQISYGNFPTIWEIIATLGPGIFYKQYYRLHLRSGVVPYLDLPYPVDYISGADLFLRKSVLTETGLFDEDFFLYFEETELAYRIKKRRYLSMILPDVKIVHLEGASSNGTEHAEKAVRFAKSRLLFFKKCYGPLTARIANYLYFLQKFFYKSKSTRKYA